MAKNRMELIESWMASAETPAAVYDDRNEREKTKPVSYSFIFAFVLCLRSSATRDERTGKIYPLLRSSLFSAIKKTKNVIFLSSSFSPVFVLLLSPSLVLQKHFQQQVDNKKRDF